MTFQQSPSRGRWLTKALFEESGAVESLAISVDPLSSRGGGSRRSTAKSSGCVLVTAMLSQQGQSQECLIIVGIKIDRLPETVFSSVMVAGGLADHPHQTIRGCGNALLPKKPLTERNCL